MTVDKFAEIVIIELKKYSLMTYTLSKKDHKKLRKLFMKVSKKHLNWSVEKRQYEFDRFSKAFDIKIKPET